MGRLLSFSSLTRFAVVGALLLLRNIEVLLLHLRLCKSFANFLPVSSFLQLGRDGKPTWDNSKQTVRCPTELFGLD